MNVLNQISLFIGIWVAIYSIDAWRREHVGRRRMELAEDTLALFYEAADAIRHIRSPVGYGHETERVERAERESDEQFEARKTASVVFYRYDQHRELFNRIHATRYRFLALFGAEAAKPFEELHEVTRKIIVAARLLAHDWGRSYFRDEAQEEQHSQRVRDQEAIFWEGMAEYDPIAPKMEELIRDIEITCRGVLESSRTLHGVTHKKLGKGS